MYLQKLNWLKTGMDLGQQKHCDQKSWAMPMVGNFVTESWEMFENLVMTEKSEPFFLVI